MGGTPAPLLVMRVIAGTNVGGPALQAAILMRGLPPDRFEQQLFVGWLAAGEADYLELRAPDVPVYRVPSLSRHIELGDDLRALGFILSEMRQFWPHIACILNISDMVRLPRVGRGGRGPSGSSQ